MSATVHSLAEADGLARKRHLRGTHRLVTPQETVMRAQPFLPVMGITRVANVTGLDRIGIPVVMVCRPNSRSLAVSQGKGVDVASARASGLMESVESYHAERITLPLKLGSHEELRYTHRMVDVERLPRHSDSRFHPDHQLLWIEGLDLVSDQPTWVPYEMVHLNYTVPLPSGHGCFVPSSNGLASGNHILEAISHGIGEVVERDATTLWYLRGGDIRGRRRLDLDSVTDASCRDLLRKFAKADVMVVVWEITSDVGMPAFLCRIIDWSERESVGVRPASGMGCHPSREVALSRALSEAAQSRLTFISGSRDDLDRATYRRHLSAETKQRWRADAEAKGPSRRFDDVATWDGDTFEEDVAWQIARLRAVGIDQVVVVDLTKPEFGLPVVRVIIPGLEALADSPKYLAGARARSMMEAMA